MKIYIQVLWVLCLGVWGVAYGQNPRVVRIQTDACSTVENFGEFFQFITGNNPYNLLTGITSIKVTNPATGGDVRLNGFMAPTQTFLNSINARSNPLCSKPYFISPYDPPYNGVIPPNSVVMVIISNSPSAELVRSNLFSSLCGKRPIFVIIGNAPLNTGMFLNKDGCPFSCLREIEINLNGTIIKYNFDANKFTTLNTGAFLEINAKDSILYKDSDGCTPFALACDTPQIVLNHISPATCSSIGHILPQFSTKVTGNEYYFTQADRKGIRYAPGTVIYDSIRLFASDFSDCDSAGTLVQQTYEVNILKSPKIDDSISRTVNVCSYYKPPKITGQNLTSTREYRIKSGNAILYRDKINFSDSLVHTSPNSGKLDTVILIAHDESGVCVDEKTIIVIFKSAPKLDNLLDVNLSCNVDFLLPTFSGTRLENPAYFTGPARSGVQFKVGDNISTSITLYVNSFFDKCISEDTFNITAPTKPIIPKSIFHNDTFCTAFKLPTYIHPVTYSTRINGVETAFDAANNLTQTAKIIFKIDSSGCESIDSAIYTKQSLFINPILLDEPCVPVYNGLPIITGQNLSGNQAYYSGHNGTGKKYSLTDTILATKTSHLYQSKVIYMYDSIGAKNAADKCTFEVPVIIPFFSIVELEPLKDSTLLCNTPFNLKSTGANFLFQADVYTGSNKTGTLYPKGQNINKSGTYYLYADFSKCHDEDTFNLTIDTGPLFINNPDITSCNKINLPIINGSSFKKDSTYYFSLPLGQGTRFNAGEEINSNLDLYIYDVSQKCNVTDTVKINITSPPVMDLRLGYSGCDSIQLPSDDLLGANIKYFTQSGGLGQSFIPGIWIKTDSRFFKYAGVPGCFSEKEFSLDVEISPRLAPVRDTTVCEEFLLPTIQGTFLSGTEHYHDSAYPKETIDLFRGQLITQSRKLWIFDWNSLGCVSQLPYNITIIPRPVIDTILPINACEATILPMLSGANIPTALFYESPNGIGNSFKSGDIITKSQTLYAYQAAPICPAERRLDITVKDSISSDFVTLPDNACVGTPINIAHTGKKNNTTTYNWKITGPGRPNITNTPSQTLQLDTGDYKITLHARGDGCLGDSVSKNVSIVKPLDPLKNLTCAITANSILFEWDKTIGATDYKIDYLQSGIFGVRTPQQLIFSNLTLGQRVGIKVSPINNAPCAEGQAASLTCVTRQCDPITINIVNEGPFCSGDAPIVLTVQSIGLNPFDTAKLTRTWSGKGIINGEFHPSVAGPGDHLITYTLTKDSCFYMDTAVFKVGFGTLSILNTKAVECAPPNVRQFNISMQLSTPNKPVSIYYSYAGGRSSVYPFVSADNFTLSASFGLIGDSITIDSVLDASGCKMQVISRANTFTFRAVKYITMGDSTSVCDFSTKTYSYRVKIKNPNPNDPLVLLSGSGTIRDSFYLSGPIPFGTSDRVVISHSFACDTLTFDLSKDCDCTPIRDTLKRSACALETVRINNKNYTINNPTGIDTIPSKIIGLCDTIRRVEIRFIPDKVFNLRSSICPDDFITVGSTIFDKYNLSGVVKLSGRASTGCDSVVNVNLDLLAPVIRRVRDTICTGTSVVIDGITFNDSHTRDSINLLNQAANGCDSIVLYTVLIENVQATVSQESAGCLSSGGKSVIISTVTGGIGPYSYSFNNNAASTPIISFPLRITSVPSDTFNLIIKSKNGCTISRSIAFDPINGNLKINLGPDRTIKLGDTVRLNLSANFNIISFRWVTANYISCTNCRNPIVQPLVSTQYIVEASDNNGCIARDTLLIKVDPVIDVFVPNIFGPNSTNPKNQDLHIYPAPQVASIVRFTIFDRWGNVYADLKNPSISNDMLVWDGKIKGGDAPSGVYTYKLVFTTVGGRSHTKYGTIVLIR